MHGRAGGTFKQNQPRGMAVSHGIYVALKERPQADPQVVRTKETAESILDRAGLSVRWSLGPWDEQTAASGSGPADRLADGCRPVLVGRCPIHSRVDSESQKICPAGRFKASILDYGNKRLVRETGSGRPSVITPADAQSSLIDQPQQFQPQPEGLIVPTLVQSMPSQDHDAHQAPGRNMVPSEVVRAGLIALSLYRIFRSSRTQCRAGSPRCSVDSAMLHSRGGSAARGRGGTGSSVAGCRGRSRVEVDRPVVVLDGLLVPP